MILEADQPAVKLLLKKRRTGIAATRRQVQLRLLCFKPSSTQTEQDKEFSSILFDHHADAQGSLKEVQVSVVIV